MNMFKFIATLSFSFILCLASSLTAKNFNERQSRYSNSLDADVEVLLGIKGELEITKKALTDIRDSQNPTVIKQAVSILSKMFKELSYVTGALTLGGGSVLVAAGIMLGGHNVAEMLKNPLGQASAMLVLPIFAGSATVMYVILKLVFDKLLAKKEPVINIQENLVFLDQIVRKIDTEIFKIERLLMTSTGDSSF